MVASMSFGMRRRNRCMTTEAEAIPSAPAEAASTTPSVTNWRIEPDARSTERATDGHLTLALLGADEEQAGDVDSGNKQEQCGSGEEHKQNGADLADDDVGERHHESPLIAVGVGILALEILRDGLDIGKGGGERDAALEPRHAEEIVAAPVLLAPAG